MSTVQERGEASTNRKRAEALARRIQATGKVKVGDAVYRVSDVMVSGTRGVISGWNVVVDGDRNSYYAVAYDRSEMIYVRIQMVKPGIVLAVGEGPTGSRALIVYRD